MPASLNRMSRAVLNVLGGGFSSVWRCGVVLAALTAALPAVLPAATPAFIQEKDNQANSGKSSAVTFSAPTTAGNLIAVYLIWDNSASASVTDSLGNTYTSALPATLWNTKYSSQIFYAITSGGADTVTAKFSTAVTQFGIVYAHEY